jgi:predicted ATPase
MTFEDILDQALALLQRRGRVTYGTLQRQFALDTVALEDLKDALLYAHPQVVDDQGRGLHWADPSTLELLGLLLDQVPTARLLLGLTARPEFRPPWAPRAHLTQLTLTRLGRQQVEEMVLRVTGGKPLPAEVMQQIVAKTDGIPLFVEELVKTVLEAGLVREDADRYVLTGPLPPLAIPATLQDALMARLDHLGTVKRVAQLGATIGRHFAYELLQALVLLDDATLQD